MTTGDYRRVRGVSGEVR